MSDSDSDQNDDLSFSKFPELPPELRARVWRLALRHPRVHRVNHPRRLIAGPTPSLAASTQPARAVLAACHEARAEGLRVLPDAIPLLAIGSGGKGRKARRRRGLLRYSAARDVLCITGLDGDALADLGRLARDAEQGGAQGGGFLTQGEQMSPEEWLSCPMSAVDERVLDVQGRADGQHWTGYIRNLAVEMDGKMDVMDNFLIESRSAEDEDEEEEGLFMLPRFFASFPSLKHAFLACINTFTDADNEESASETGSESDDASSDGEGSESGGGRTDAWDGIGGIFFGDDDAADCFCWASESRRLTSLPGWKRIPADYDVHVEETSELCMDIADVFAGGPMACNIPIDLSDADRKRLKGVDIHALVQVIVDSNLEIIP